MSDELLRAVRERQEKSTEFGYGITTADRYAKNVLDAVGLEVAYKCAATRTVSWDDVMKKAARTLVYSNQDMVTEEIEYSKRAGSALKKYDDIELPKNCLMVFRHVLTTPRKDRDGDVLRTGGAKVDPKMILLWNHVHTLPIGKMLAISDHNAKKLSLISCIVDMNDLSHDCAVMIDNGMGRFSHGFRAIEFTKIKSADGEKESGFDVKDFEIMEESLVTVPSNTDAEVEELMLGLVEGGKMTSPIMKEYGKTIRDHRPKQFAGIDFAKVSLPIDLKITLNGKEISNEDLSGNGGGSAAGAEREERKDATGLDKEADAKAAGDKAEEATSDAEMKCPECGAMVPKSAKVCPECGYKFGEGESDDGDDEEDDEMPENEKSVKSGRTISRGNMSVLKEVHGDIHELDRGDHVLSVEGRKLCGRARTKLKGFIDEWDREEVEQPKSFTVEDAVAVVIGGASRGQRAMIRKAFDAIEQVERMNADAKQYRGLIGKANPEGHNQYTGRGGGGGSSSGGGGGSGGGGSGTPEVNKIHNSSINSAASMAKVQVSHSGSKRDGDVDVHSFQVQGGSANVDKLRQRLDREGVGGMETHQQSPGRFVWSSRSPLSTTGRHVRYEFTGTSPF